MKRFLKIAAALLLVSLTVAAVAVVSSASGAVAKIGDVEYPSMSDAWSAALASEDTNVKITLLTDITTSVGFAHSASGKTIEVDLANHTVNAGVTMVFGIMTDGTLAVKNGNINCEGIAIQTTSATSNLVLENLVINKTTANTTTAITFSSLDTATINNVEVNAQRCIGISGSCKLINATGLISNATTSNALRISSAMGTYNFTDCVFTTTESGRVIESTLSPRNTPVNSIGTEGVHFNASPISTDSSTGAVTYKVTETTAAVFNLYGCTVKNYKSGSGSMLIRPGLATFNLYGGFYYAPGASTFISNSYGNYTQGCAVVNFRSYTKDGVTYYPAINIDPTSSGAVGQFYLQDFYDVTTTYTVTDGEYSYFTTSATKKTGGATVVSSSSNGDYKYIVVPNGESYSAFPTPTDPQESEARIGSTYYATLADAVSCAKSGDTIVLTTDIANASIAENCFINLNGHTLTVAEGSPCVVFSGGLMGADFVSAGKKLTVNVNFWNSTEAAANHAQSGSTEGLVYTVSVEIVDGIAGDFSSGYCDEDLSYTDTEGNEYVHSGWIEYSRSGSEYNYTPNIVLKPNIFEVVSSAGIVIKRGNTPEAFQSEMLNPTESGETIRMLGDIELQAVNQGITAANKPYTLDLNGYTLSVLSTQSGAMYKTYQKIDLTITSSRPGGFINNIRGKSSAQMFWAASGANGKLTINGDNLKIASGCLFGSSTSSSFTLDINGGEYEAPVGTNRAFFAFNTSGNCTVTVDGAYVNSAKNHLISFGKSNTSTTKSFDVTFTDCIINTGANTLLNLSDGTYFESSRVTFLGSYITSVINSMKGNEVVIGEGCMLASMRTAGAILANPLHDIDEVTVGGYTFTLSSSSPKYLATIIWQCGEESFVTYADRNDKDVVFNKTVSDGGVSSTYTGICSGKLEAGKTYTVELEKSSRVAVEDIKYNLTLASNMDVNIAIPVNAFTNLRASYLGASLKGKYTIIDSKDYYVVTVKAVNAISTTSPITVVLEHDGAVPQEITVSVAEYAKALMTRGSTEEAVELGRAILTYALEAQKSLAPEDTGAIAALTEALAGTTAPKDVTFSRGDTTELSKYFKGAHLRLTSTPGIVFTLADALNSLECDISYTDANGKLVTRHFSLTSENREAVVSEIKVYEFDSDLTVTVAGDAPMTYNLESYLASESVEDSFAQAIHHYVVATKAYMEISRTYFDLGSITVGGESIEDAVIVTDTANDAAVAAARMLRAEIYSKSGIYLGIENLDYTSEKRIVICGVSDAGNDTFRVRVVDGELYLECEYIDYFIKGMTKFIKDELANATGELSFASDYLYECNAYFVRYSEFGATGDGVTNDYPAIIRTHYYANLNKISVEADPGATYYISFVPDEAVIKTNTYWGDAKFIIDDRAVTVDESSYDIFRIESDSEPYSLPIPSGMTPKTTDTNVGLTFDSKVMLFVKNSGERVYVRPGAGGNAGALKSDVLIVDENGNIDESTPFVFDYKAVTNIVVYPIDDTPITVSGGTLITRYNQTMSNKFFQRGIKISRANVTLKDVEHYLTDEPEDEFGASSYGGFFHPTFAYNLHFDSCVFTAHKVYKMIQGDGDIAGQGNYDMSISNSINVKFTDCTQSNDINGNTWGFMGSNHCKNISWEGCTLSRFDAHCGVHNVDIRNSTIGEIINLVGSGTAYFENVTRTGTGFNYFIRLREDYGAIWDGDVIIKDCTLTVSNNAGGAYVFRADWMSFEFGYDCQLPNVKIDGFRVVRTNGSEFDGKLYIFKNFDSTYTGDLRQDAVNPLFAPKTITLKDITYYDILEGTNNDVVFSETVVTKED